MWSQNFFREYFLGQSIGNIFFRLAFILSILIIIWSCLICILTIQIKRRKNKQLTNQLRLNSPPENHPPKRSSSIRQNLNDKKLPLVRCPLPTNRNRSLSIFILSKDLRRPKQRSSSLIHTDPTLANLPLVMITDTNSSHTNILELETFADKSRIITEQEKLLFQQFKASYRPRYST